MTLMYYKIIFAPDDDILLVLGEVHALMSRVLQTAAYIGVTIRHQDVNIIQREHTNFVFNNMNRVIFIIAAGTPAGRSVTLEFNHTAGYTINPDIMGRMVNIRILEGGVSATQLNAAVNSIKDCIESSDQDVVRDIVKTIR